MVLRKSDMRKPLDREAVINAGFAIGSKAAETGHREPTLDNLVALIKQAQQQGIGIEPKSWYKDGKKWFNTADLENLILTAQMWGCRNSAERAMRYGFKEGWDATAQKLDCRNKSKGG